MKRILLLTIIISFSFSINIYPSVSIGISETMGEKGGVDLKLNISDYFFLNAGSSLLFGGGGAGFRYSYNFSRVSPFITSSIFTGYWIPLMCESCDGLIYELFSTGAIGVDVNLFKIKNKIRNTNFSLQLGIMRYLYSEGITRSLPPNVQPGNLPFLNLKMSL